MDKKKKFKIKENKLIKNKKDKFLKQKEILAEINNFFKSYKNNLEGKEFLIIYNKNGILEKISLKFLKENFFHLLGLHKTSKKSALKFYESLEKKTLRAEDIEIGNFTERKLSVYQGMINIFRQQSRIAEYNPNNSYQKNLLINKGMALVDVESEAVLGIRYSNPENKIAVPVSLLKQKLKNICYRETETNIICMFEKNINENFYSRIIYKNIDIKILLEERNKEIAKLLNSKLLEK